MKNKILLAILLSSLIYPVDFVSANMNDIKNSLMYGNFQQAQNLAEDFLAANTDQYSFDEAYYYLGVSYLKQKEYDQSKSVFQELLNRFPTESLRDQATLGLFDSYYLAENYEESYKVIKDLILIAYKSDFLSSMYFRMARASMKLGYWDEGYLYLRKIVDYKPNSFDYEIAKQFLEEPRYYAVQIGAFSERERAAQQVDQLKKDGKAAYIVETTDQNKKTFYRVRIGQMTMLSEALDLQSQLAKQGFPTQVYP